MCTRRRNWTFRAGMPRRLASIGTEERNLSVRPEIWPDAVGYTQDSQSLLKGRRIPCGCTAVRICLSSLLPEGRPRSSCQITRAMSNGQRRIAAGGWSLTCRMADLAAIAARCCLSRRALWPLAQPSDAARTAACKGEWFTWCSNMWMALAVAEASRSLCSQESLSGADGSMACLDAGSVARPGRPRSWGRRLDSYGCAQVLTPAQLRAIASFTGERLSDCD